MWRVCRPQLTKRTPGYVFWRQKTLIGLEHAKRNYLLSERPYPVAEIARRMVRIRGKYEETHDYHEQNLLRGEYKYFSGKLCDCRQAQPSDMIAFLECCTFFGFWDTAQVDRMMDELLLRLDELSPNELVHLFLCLPGVRRQQSSLYHAVAEQLVPLVPELSYDEMMRMLRACEMEDPPELIQCLLRGIEPIAKSKLTADQCVTVVQVLACCDEGTQKKHAALLETVKMRAVEECAELSVLEIAELCESLRVLDTLDPATVDALLAVFLTRQHEIDAHSMALMFSATSSYALAEAAEDRILFLASSFTPGELLAILRVYYDLYCSLTLAFPIASPDSTTSTEKDSSSAALAEKRQAEQRGIIRQRLMTIKQTIQELNDQMVLILKAAASHVSPETQVSLLQALGQCVEAEEEAKSNSVGSAVGLPLLRQLVNATAAHSISCMRTLTNAELFALLDASNLLGSTMPDSVVVATLQELQLRELALTSEDALMAHNNVVSMDRLRAVHRKRIEGALIPKLRLMISQEDLQYAS